MDAVLAFDNIAALSTPPGTSGIAVIRLSGPTVVSICDQAFQPAASFPRAAEMQPYTMALGTFCDREGRGLDQVILSAYRAPHSYTGEDLFEISCHGGTAVRRSILESLFERGVRPAGPGEFSKRAFLNGKMDLMQAEAVMDLIHAESRLQQQTALAEVGGALSRALSEFSERLYGVEAALEMMLEFPDEEDRPEARERLRENTAALVTELDSALAGWKQGRILRDGFRLVIAGRPNAGKSSLLNELLGEERAIVSGREGTTRDTVEALMEIEGIPLLLTDTAGLRDSEDELEAEGVSRARRAAENADLILWLHDPTQAEASLAELASMKEALPQADFLLLSGKADLDSEHKGLEDLRQAWPESQILSWQKGGASAIQALREAILARYEAAGAGSQNRLLIHNLRHKRGLEEAKKHLELALKSMDDGLTLDLTAAMLRAAQEDFAELTGREVSAELADQIFSRFCVGK